MSATKKPEKQMSYLEQFRKSNGIEPTDEACPPSSSLRPNVGDEDGSIGSFGTMYCDEECAGDCYNDIFYKAILDKDVKNLEEVQSGTARGAAKKKILKKSAPLEKILPLGGLGPDLHKVKAESAMAKKKRQYSEMVRLNNKIKYAAKKAYDSSDADLK